MGYQDARLQSISPCIDTGYNSILDMVIEDIDGTSRPLGDGIDMGCYEMLGNLWSLKWINPLAMFNMSNANSMWSCIMENLPAEIDPEAEVLIEDVQALMGQAGPLANPIFQNGLLQQALGKMEEINEILECGCHS